MISIVYSEIRNVSEGEVSHYLEEQFDIMGKSWNKRNKCALLTQ